MLSIVIPVREEEKVIAETIGRHRRLTMPHEIIVSDAGSKDKTQEIARSLGVKIVVMQGGKPTPSRQRNDGAKVADGQFLVFMDADCIILEPDEFFAKALKHFEDDARLVGLTVPQHARPDVEQFMDKIGFGILNGLIWLQNNVLGHGEANGKFMMVRTEAFRKIGGFREDLVTREDADLFYRLSRIGKTHYDGSLHVYHGARRAHKLGWWRLWWIWTLNTIYVSWLGRAYSTDWTPVR